MCQQRLLDGGLGKQRYSFQLLPAYRDAVELRSPSSTVDLQIDQRTGKSFAIILFIAILISIYLQAISSESLYVHYTYKRLSSSCDASSLLIEPSLQEGSS